MTSGPLPPHERTWRHPSEVAAEQRAELSATPPEPGTLPLALGSGVIALALLIVTLLAAVASQGGVPAVELKASAPVTRVSHALVTLPAEPIRLSADEVDAVAAPDPRASTILATPIGDGSLALVTTASLVEVQAEAAAEVLVQLPDQSLQSAQVIANGVSDVPELSVVRLTSPAPPLAVASERAASDDVVVISVQRVEVRFADVAALGPPDGTSIVNLSGELVAITTSDSQSGPCTVVPTDQDSVDELLHESVDESSPFAAATTEPANIGAVFGDIAP